jgi:hypothetical protein
MKGSILGVFAILLVFFGIIIGSDIHDMRTLQAISDITLIITFPFAIVAPLWLATHPTA